MKVRTGLALALMLATSAALAQTGANNAQNKIAYPTPHRGKTVDTYFGTQVPAPYQWMENLNSKKLHEWVNKENKITDAYLAKIPVRRWIKTHLTQLWNYPKEGTPTQLENGMLFFSRNSGLQNQSVVYVQQSARAKPRVLLNPNKLSTNGQIALAFYVPSHSGRYLAYALSVGGSDWETIHVMNVKTGKTLPDSVKWVKFSGISWTHDNQGFFYSRYPTPPKNE
jgi:prolyl oligopeptidase